MVGKTHSPEAIAKMKANRTGKGLGPRPKSPEWRAAISRGKMGKPNTNPNPPITAEQRKRMSDAAKARVANGLPGNALAVEIDGIVYETGKHAAAALGVCYAAMKRRVDQGMGRWLNEGPDAAQTRPWGSIQAPGPTHHRARPIVIDGLRFPSGGAAAEHFGVKMNVISYWLKKGRAIHEKKYKPSISPASRPERRAALGAACSRAAGRPVPEARSNPD